MQLDPDAMQLDPEQQSAVFSDKEALCIVAGPGAGKTKVLSARIAHLLSTRTGLAPRTTAVTFTRKAASELSQRLQALVGDGSSQVRVGTFHWLALEGLRIGWGKRARRPPAILSDLMALASRLRPKVDRPWLSMALDEISWAQARLIGPDGYEEAAISNGRPPWGDAKEVAELFWDLSTEKRRRHVLDLGDLIPAYLELLESDSELAAAQRWMAQAVFVDEMQDSNLAQLAVLSAWLDLPELRAWAQQRALPRRAAQAERALSSGHASHPVVLQEAGLITQAVAAAGSGQASHPVVLQEGRLLCVVGDPDQAIYSWNGSDPELMRLLPELIEGMEVVELKANYRSASEIARAASALIGSPGKQSPMKPMETSSPGRAPRSLSDSPVILVSPREDEHDEALWVVSQLCEWASSRTGWQGCAVLARTRQQLGYLARRLDAEGVPWQLKEPSKDPSKDGSSSQEDPSDTAVQLASFHQAKGLEWDAVWLVGLEEGLIPHSNCITQAQIEEERRVLYVALTRARFQVRGSWCKKRTLLNGKVLACKPSRFLFDLGLDLDPPQAPRQQAVSGIYWPGGGEVKRNA